MRRKPTVGACKVELSLSTKFDPYQREVACSVRNDSAARSLRDLVSHPFPYGLTRETPTCSFEIGITHLHLRVVDHRISGSFVVGHDRRAPCDQTNPTRYTTSTS